MLLLINSNISQIDLNGYSLANFMQDITHFKERIENSLNKFFERKLKNSNYSKDTLNLVSNLSEYTMRKAKRIRPIFGLFAYKCFNDSRLDEDKIIDASIALELIQSYLLIHDDIIDNSDLRRGKPTIHKVYSKYNSDFGKSMAILAGDLASSFVYDSIIESNLTDKQKINAAKWCCWILDREIYGQTMDILPNYENISEEDVLKIYELKTATYTVQGPLYFGASLAEAPEDKIKKLEEYAYNIGLAFQLQDDIIGIFGDVEETGKPNDSDIKEGKKTLLLVKTLQFCNQHDKKFFLEKYGNKDINNEDIDRIRKIIKESGAYDYCIKRLDEFILNGKKSIIALDIKKEGKDFLLEMADYIRSLV